MKLFLSSLLLLYGFLLCFSNFSKTIAKVINNNNVKQSTNNWKYKNGIKFLNTNGLNFDVNYSQNQNVLDIKSESKTGNMKSPTKDTTGQVRQSFPDYLLEADPHYSSLTKSRQIDEDFEDSLNSNKFSNDFNSTKYLELSVFVDHKAYENIRRNGLIETDSDFNELILSYINQIEAIYSHKGFAQKLFINLVKIEIQKKDFFLTTDGNRDQLLKRFCEYQSEMNPTSDTDPLHWDMALLLTGYDLYVVRDDNTRDYKSLGLGSVSGICSLERNCVITEFEAINDSGELWPSSGLMSTWAAAHEMAHNLGILHDGWPFNIECPTNGYIMSSSRGNRGETNWSECSANNFRQSYIDCLNDKPIVRNEKYDHNKYKSRPGVVWDSDKQCKLFMRDVKAFEFPKTKARICNETILCVSPNRIGFYSSGPALEGTKCGSNSWCVDGMCQSWSASDLQL